MRLAHRHRHRHRRPPGPADTADPAAPPTDAGEIGDTADTILVRVTGVDLSTMARAVADRGGHAGRYRWTERTDLTADFSVAPDVERALTANAEPGSDRPVVIVWDRTTGASGPGTAVRVLEGGADAFVASPDIEVLLAQLDALVRRPPRTATAHLRSLAEAV